ncbi:YdeI/OmpD-associated family protein [Paenibacillus sp. HJGM_3]|uniref:YdeI/OmpD-associated family protein n=1 Tax=Paenibacillus sp. HJGM_3 TaxID=3379816 RepID=UPI00385DF481
MATFTANLELHGKTATGIEVPEEIVVGLGNGKKPAVRVTFRGYTYRTTIGVMGGKFLIPVSAEHRERAGIAAGDLVEVQLELDTEPRELVVPADFLEALAQNEKAKSFFEGLSYSNKRRFVLSIEEAKTAETRQRRIEKAVSSLAVEKI